MLILVSGGASSGKSAFAEELIVRSGLKERIYLVTMQVWDKESERRVERHRAMRAGKGFATLERPLDLAGLPLPPGSAVLLEDLTNLTANEYFGPQGPKGALERLTAGLRQAAASPALLVAVTGELFSDGIAYDPETAQYLTCLAQLNRAAAAQAEQVFEVVCGIPIPWKGAQP